MLKILLRVPRRIKTEILIRSKEKTYKDIRYLHIRRGDKLIVVFSAFGNMC